MALFGFSKKDNSIDKNKSSNNRKMLRQYSYISSKSFRGFKKVYIVAHGYSNYTENTNKLIGKYGQKFENLPITLDIYKSDSIIDNPEYAEVVIDGLPIGAFFSSTPYYNEIINGEITEIYVRNEVQNKVSSDGLYAENHAQVFVKLDW